MGCSYNLTVATCALIYSADLDSFENHLLREKVALALDTVWCTFAPYQGLAHGFSFQYMRNIPITNGTVQSREIPTMHSISISMSIHTSIEQARFDLQGFFQLVAVLASSWYCE
jgi:hypothetical protein